GSPPTRRAVAVYTGTSEAGDVSPRAPRCEYLIGSRLGGRDANSTHERVGSLYQANNIGASYRNAMTTERGTRHALVRTPVTLDRSNGACVMLIITAISDHEEDTLCPFSDSPVAADEPITPSRSPRTPLFRRTYAGCWLIGSRYNRPIVPCRVTRSFTQSSL